MIAVIVDFAFLAWQVRQDALFDYHANVEVQSHSVFCLPFYLVKIP